MAGENFFLKDGSAMLVVMIVLSTILICLLNFWQSNVFFENTSFERVEYEQKYRAAESVALYGINFCKKNFDKIFVSNNAINNMANNITNNIISGKEAGEIFIGAGKTRDIVMQDSRTSEKEAGKKLDTKINNEEFSGQALGPIELEFKEFKFSEKFICYCKLIIEKVAGNNSNIGENFLSIKSVLFKDSGEKLFEINCKVLKESGYKGVYSGDKNGDKNSSLSGPVLEKVPEKLSEQVLEKISKKFIVADWKIQNFS